MYKLDFVWGHFRVHHDTHGSFFQAEKHSTKQVDENGLFELVKTRPGKSLKTAAPQVKKRPTAKQKSTSPPKKSKPPPIVAVPRVGTSNVSRVKKEAGRIILHVCL